MERLSQLAFILILGIASRFQTEIISQLYFLEDLPCRFIDVPDFVYLGGENANKILSLILKASSQLANWKRNGKSRLHN